MKPRISVITLAVDDLERSLAFYRDGLGLPSEGIIGTEFPDGAVAFFKLNGGSLILAIWPRASLVRETKVQAARSSSEFTIGHLVGSKGAVDELLAAAVRAGATLIAPAADRAWGGYSGYFRDPDGHLWEVVWNPQLPPPD